MEQIYRINIASQKIFEEHLTIQSDEYKKRMFVISYPEGCTRGGEPDITRWRAMDIPNRPCIKLH